MGDRCWRGRVWPGAGLGALSLLRVISRDLAIAVVVAQERLAWALSWRTGESFKRGRRARRRSQSAAGKRSSWVAKLGLRGRRLVIGRSWKAAAGGSGAGGPTKAGAGGAEARALNWRDRRSLMVGGAGGEALAVGARSGEALAVGRRLGFGGEGS